MNRAQAYTLVRQTFTDAFDKNRYSNFSRNLLNHVDESKAASWSSQYVKDAFKDHIQRYERLATYTSPQKEKLDVLIVHLTRESKLERARTAIRNFVADHLKERDDKDAALVAFVSPSETTWRFSYVKMEYATVEKDSGKVGVETRLTPARRSSYIVGEGESCHTAQTRFLGLLQDTLKDPALADIEEAFSVEAVTKEFFTKYAQLFGEIHKALEKLAVEDKPIRDEFAAKGVNTVDFAKKLMGQIVFLYFLQKKGWLGVAQGQDWGGGPRDFLRRMANGEYGRYDNFFNDILEPLFYDTLATDRGHEAWCDRFKCRIPFLNGGLFEPLGDYDWRKTDIILPNRLFTNTEPIEEGITGTGVLDVFDRYNFTVNEAEPLEKDVAIDPEFLGKVFEKLNAINQNNIDEFRNAEQSGQQNLIREFNRKNGVFYTPREIVHYMCQESLVNYLDTAINTGHEPIAADKPGRGKLFGPPEPEQVALRIAAYRELVPRSDIETFVHLGEQISHYEAVDAKYRIKMPKCIVRHARLIDEKLAEITICDPAVGSGAFPVGMMNEIVRARCALRPYFNAVHERTPYYFKRHAIQKCLYGVDIDAGAVEIAKLRLWLSLVVDEEDVKHIKPLPNLDYKIVAGNSLFGFPFKSQRLQQIEELKRAFFDETDHEQKAKLKAQVDKLLAECFAASKKSLGYEVNFDFKIVFSEVFQRKGGFDVTIGNPPYVRVDEIPALQKERFKQTFKSTVGKYDLYYLFIEKGCQLVKDKGVLAFITPNKYCAASSAKVLREIVLSTMGRCEIVSTSKLGVFEQAANYPVISILEKGQPATIFAVREALAIERLRDSTDSVYRLQHEQFKQFPKTLIPINVSQPKIGFVLRLLNKWPRLHNYFSISEGLRIPAKYEQESKSDFRIVKQYQFERWAPIREGTHISSRHLRSVASETSSRFKKIIERKVLIAEDGLLITATFDEHKHVPQGGVYFGTAMTSEIDLKVILALLNSQLLSAIYEILFSGMHMGGGYLRYRTSFLEELPVADVPNTESAKIISLVDRILAAKKRDPKADTTALEREIDRLVYELYGLTAEEIAIVEEAARGK